MCRFDLAQTTKGLYYVECECLLFLVLAVDVSLRQAFTLAFGVERYRPASDLRSVRRFSSAMHLNMLCILLE